MAGSEMNAGAAGAPKRKTRRGLGMLVPIGFLLLFFGGITAAGFASFRRAQRYEASADAFLSAVRGGEIDEAYRLLSPRRRASMSTVEFRALAEHRALRHNRRHRVDSMRVVGGTPAHRACVRARLEVDEEEWLTQLHLVRGDDDAWHVESFALQEVAPVVLSDLLEECGDSPQSRVGYSGPPVVNRTPRLR
ncbi:MAG: hypothetical protein KIT84_35000 [Labilithrix sp.]|nr:hypothetical protein [Labilithrix sp.]MCW5816258.1 hypothetical protein [Labilithrix sp.]